MSDVLRHLWESSAEFYQRFNCYPPETHALLRVMNEEYFELIEAAFAGDNHALADEAADLIVTIMGTLMSCGVSLDGLEAAIERVAAKNDAKTHETHFIDQNGKIARRND